MPARPLNIIGPHLRRLRYERGMSQPDLAAECQRRGWDVSWDTIANIEGPRRWVADFELMLIASALSVPTFTSNDAGTQEPHTTNSQGHRRIFDLIEDYPNVSQAKRYLKKRLEWRRSLLVSTDTASEISAVKIKLENSIIPMPVLFQNGDRLCQL